MVAVIEKKRKKKISKRSELYRPVFYERENAQHPAKEWGFWVLWSGISPESSRPVSHIGIYTDFT